MSNVILTLLLATARASVLIGNPSTTIVLAKGSPIWVQSIEAHRCSNGTQTLPVNTVVDASHSPTVVFDEDDFCAIDLNVKWTPEGSVQTIAVDGFDTFKSTSGTRLVAIQINATDQTAVLQ